MGDWTVVIVGKGTHHNRDHKDADEIISKALEQLRVADQDVSYAIFVAGRVDYLRKVL